MKKINKDYFNIENYIDHYNTQFKKKSKSKILVINFWNKGRRLWSKKPNKEDNILIQDKRKWKK